MYRRLKLPIFIIQLFYLLNYLPQFCRELLLLNGDLTQRGDSRLVLFVYSDLILANETEIFFEAFGAVSKYFPHLMVTRTFDIVAHVNNEFDMATTLFEVLGMSTIPLLAQYLDILLNIDELVIHSINF